jgi:mediator of RNA polymerase II transcription subunit 12
MTEKVRSSGDGGLLKLLIPGLLNFVPDILTSEILSRKLAGTCAKYLAGICHPLTRNGTAAGKAPLTLLEEALECSHHGVPVRGIIGLLQLIAIENPVACMWIPLGDERANSQVEGSPLDFLPLCPSELPVSPTVVTIYPDFKERIKQTEEEIRNRSMLVESKWLSPKTTSGISNTFYYN